MADQASEGLLSPFLRRRRLEAARPYLKGRVLDMGCGSGGLAEAVLPEDYLGVDTDPQSVEIAKVTHPRHCFRNDLPAVDGEKFDTVVALAVIEHVRDAAAFLRSLADRLEPGADACIVCTTPHPSAGWIHGAGAAVGLFSKHASDEHEELLDGARLMAAGEAANLAMIIYKRFLLGTNQLAVFAAKARAE